MADRYIEETLGATLGEPTLFSSPDELHHIRVSDDGDRSDGLRYAVWSCNVIFCRTRTLACANRFAAVCAKDLGLMEVQQ